MKGKKERKKRRRCSTTEELGLCVQFWVSTWLKWVLQNCMEMQHIAFHIFIEHYDDSYKSNYTRMKMKSRPKQRRRGRKRKAITEGGAARRRRRGGGAGATRGTRSTRRGGAARQQRGGGGGGGANRPTRWMYLHGCNYNQIVNREHIFDHCCDDVPQ